MHHADYILGVLTGIVVALIFILAFYNPNNVYLVESSGVVESVTKMENRGSCLLELERIYSKGPAPLMYQCVGE